ncbi:hypothetical protein Tco_0497278 [Tanacetum coccineum]
MVIEGEVLKDFPRFVGILIAEFKFEANDRCHDEGLFGSFPMERIEQGNELLLLIMLLCHTCDDLCTVEPPRTGSLSDNTATSVSVSSPYNKLNSIKRSSHDRYIHSPELQPLPPLKKTQLPTQQSVTSDMTSSSSSDDDGFKEVEEETNEFYTPHGFTASTTASTNDGYSFSSDTPSDHQHSSDIILRDMKLLNVGRKPTQPPPLPPVLVTPQLSSLITTAEIKEGSLIGPELVQETTDKVVVIKEKLQAVRDRQKSYADSRRKMTEYEVGENVLLKVSPWKGVMLFGKKGKLAPRYVGPFEILERIGPVAYRLRLPNNLIGVHDTFHVSNLKKCLGNANLHVSLNEIKIGKTLRFVEEPVEIMDREVKSLKRSRIPLVKVRWDSKRGPEFTWEREDYMKSKYPQLFVDLAVEPTS